MYNDETAEIIEYHRSMLSDDTRTTAFLKAILETVHPGDVVLDIGTGTGVLASFACMAGARHVYAAEHGPVAELARRVIAANGLSKRVTIIDDWSTSITLDEPADVLITETIGNVGLDEGILGWVIDARKRLLKPDARLVPLTVDVVIAPVESPSAFRQIERWSPQLHSLDFSPVREVAANTIYWAEISPAGVLAEPAVAISVDLATVTRRSATGSATFTTTRDGVIHGIGGWFRSRLSPSVTLDTDPPIAARSWNNGFFPLGHPVTVAAGEHLTAILGVADNGATWEWSLAPTSTTGDAVVQHTGRGDLLRATGLLPLDHRPQPTEDGAIDAFVIGLINGHATLAEIATGLRSGYPDRFPSDRQAAAHAEDVIVRYTNPPSRRR